MDAVGAAVGRPLRQSDPTELGPYRLLRRIGEGGMGSVYLAQKGEGGRLVALKVIRRDLANDTEFRRRFRGEVTRAKQVPAFCTAEVLDADPDHEPPYLVVEFVNGPSLARVVQSQGPLSQANLHGLAIGVATALTAIHGAGVIHRDLKPANVLLALGSPKVIDFGIARAVEATATDSSPNMLMGTIPYMAPERLDPAGNKPLSPAADIFAWGAIVAFAGTGKAPFGSDSVETVARILTQEPDLSGLTGDLRELVARALAKRPQDRPTARELLDHLVGPRTSAAGLIQAGSEQAVVSVGSTSDTTKLSLAPVALVARRRWVPAALTASVVALSIVVAGFLTGLIRPPVLASGSPPSSSPSVSVSPSSSPSPSPSPSVSVSPSPRPPSFVNALGAPDAFFKDNDLTEQGQGKCELDDGLTVRLWKRGTFRCPSYVNQYADMRLEVDVTINTVDTCAGIWFRDINYVGYLLFVCTDKYMIYLSEGQDTVGFFTKEVLPTIGLKKTFRAGIEIRGDQLSLLYNGEVLATTTHGAYTAGKFLLGIAIPGSPQPSPQPKPYEVKLENLEVWDLSSSQP